MVIATVVSPNGTFSEVTVPSKTTDVLEWMRKKYKSPEIQFQGKFQDPQKETRWISIFAAIADDEDEPNQHVLPPPFNEETYTGPILVFATNSEDQDSYEQHIHSYISLKSDEYDALYNALTFADDEEEEDAIADMDDEEEEEEEMLDDEEEDEPVLRTHVPTRPVHIETQDVFVSCAIREKVTDNFKELLIESDALDLEDSMLHGVVEQALQSGINVDWTNKVFWNLYRNRAVSVYENLKGSFGHNWVDKIKSGEITAREFAGMHSVDMCPSRWKAAIERIIEQEKKLYSKNTTASIFMKCSNCKKKTKCDYYQMQTRSADEPMTTFVTCLECDRKWKF